MGTTRFTNIDVVNRPDVRRAVDEMSNASRGAWLLYQAMNKLKGSKENLAVAWKCGLVVLKGRTLVIFYINLLADTPRNLVQ